MLTTKRLTFWGPSRQQATYECGKMDTFISRFDALLRLNVNAIE